MTAAATFARLTLAADPQPYEVNIQTTGNAALDAALHGSSQLESLRTSAPAGPFALVGRAQQDVERLQTVLESFGYYQRRVCITVNGRPLDDPGLPDTIAALPEEQTAKVDVSLATGPLYRLRQITIDGAVSEQARSAMALATGAPAVAADVLAAHDRLLNALEEEGHALAKVEAPVAYEDEHEPVLDVSFKVEAGPRFDIGEIHFTGLRRVHEAFIRKRLLLHSAEQYSPGKIERARTDLLALGTFSAVTVHTPDQVDPDGRLPITFDVQERARHAVNLNAGYSTDLGGSGGVSWSDRNLFGNAEQLNLTANAINWGGRATKSLGYNVGAQLIQPDFLRRDQSLQWSIGALSQQLDAYTQTAETAGVGLNRKLSTVWSASLGLSVEQEHISQEGQVSDYTLFAIPVTARYDSTDLTNPLDDPLHGLRASLSVTPTDSLGHIQVAGTSRHYNVHATFVVLQANISTYFDLAELGWAKRGRSVIALRALGGNAYGASEDSLPPDQRFYGGGSATVRGFSYQSVGPKFPDGNPQGGTAIGAASAEFRQRLWTHFGAAVFIDGAEVTDTTRPLQGRLSVGYGAGVRYYTPIGPLRLDLALPTRRPESVDAATGKTVKGDTFEIYLGLGQVF